MTPHLTTRVPQVIDGLLSILGSRDLIHNENVQVLDGPALNLDMIQKDSICVAPGTIDQPGVLVTYAEQTSFGRTAYVEQVEVTIALASQSGNVAMKPRRDRVTALLGELQAGLTDNQVRVGAWDSITLGPEAVWHPVLSPQGATCAVGVTVVAKSII